jgi:hypothetical protein
VVQSAMDEHQRGLAVLAVIPELQFQSVRIKKVLDWFHVGRLSVTKHSNVSAALLDIGFP